MNNAVSSFVLMLEKQRNKKIYKYKIIIDTDINGKMNREINLKSAS